MRQNYMGLDTAILARIQFGHTFAHQIEGGRVVEEARYFSSVKNPEFRIIDRRLQALRKAGKIAYDRKKGWQLVPATLSASQQQEG